MQQGRSGYAKDSRDDSRAKDRGEPSAKHIGQEFVGRELVDLIGIEPMTSSMPWKRAPSCATGPHAAGMQLFYCLCWGGFRQSPGPATQNPILRPANPGLGRSLISSAGQSATPKLRARPGTLFPDPVSKTIECVGISGYQPVPGIPRTRRQQRIPGGGNGPAADHLLGWI